MSQKGDQNININGVYAEISRERNGHWAPMTKRYNPDGKKPMVGSETHER